MDEFNIDSINDYDISMISQPYQYTFRAKVIDIIRLSYFCQKHEELQMQLKTFLWRPILCCRKHDKLMKNTRGILLFFVNAFYGCIYIYSFIIGYYEVLEQLIILSLCSLRVRFIRYKITTLYVLVLLQVDYSIVLRVLKKHL